MVCQAMKCSACSDFVRWSRQIEIEIKIILHTLAVILDSKNLIDNLCNVIVFFF